MTDIPNVRTLDQEDMIEALMDSPRSDWELNFLENLSNQEYPLTDKQRTCLMDMYEKEMGC